MTDLYWVVGGIAVAAIGVLLFLMAFAPIRCRRGRANNSRDWMRW